MSGLLNKKAFRRFVLEVASRRAHPFRRVSDETIAAAEAHLRRFVEDTVNGLPSRGRTVYPLVRPQKTKPNSRKET